VKVSIKRGTRQDLLFLSGLLLPLPGYESRNELYKNRCRSSELREPDRHCGCSNYWEPVYRTW